MSDSEYTLNSDQLSEEEDSDPAPFATLVAQQTLKSSPAKKKSPSPQTPGFKKKIKEQSKEQEKIEPNLKKKKKIFLSAEEKRRDEEEAYGPVGEFFQTFNPGEKISAKFWLDQKIHQIANSKNKDLTSTQLQAFLEQAAFRKITEPGEHSQLLLGRTIQIFRKESDRKGFPEFNKFVTLFRGILDRCYVPKPVIQLPLFFPSKENQIHLARVLRRAKQSIYVAIFTFTNNRLAEALIDRHKAGLEIMIITDDVCSGFSGADIFRLAALGIPCTMDNNKRFHMHHKFAILDGRILITGSFNWSSQAVTGNQENLIVIENQYLCKEYKRQFDEMWVKFSANQLKQDECVKKVAEEEAIEKKKKEAKKAEKKKKIR